MNEKNSCTRYFFVRLFSFCAFICVVLIAIAQVVSRDDLFKILKIRATATPVKEVIALPVNTIQEVFTSQEYSGYVTIIVRGEGQINSSTRHDAFSMYSADRKLGRFDGFAVDGASLILRAFSVVPTPTNYPQHEYRFLYEVGERPQKIAFRIVNGNAEDTSVFIVEVTSENLIFSSGR